MIEWGWGGGRREHDAGRAKWGRRAERREAESMLFESVPNTPTLLTADI